MNNIVSLKMAKKLKKNGWDAMTEQTYMDSKVYNENPNGKYIARAPNISELLDEIPGKLCYNTVDKMPAKLNITKLWGRWSCCYERTYGERKLYCSVYDEELADCLALFWIEVKKQIKKGKIIAEKLLKKKGNMEFYSKCEIGETGIRIRLKEV